MLRHAIGVDVGGTKILAGVVRDDGTIVRRVERPTPTESQDELLRAIKSLVDELVDDGVMGIGVAVPGTIDYDRGRCVFAANVPLVGANVREWLTERQPLPVAVENDARAATIGEWRAGAARGASDVVMLTIGTGLGSGVIAAGRPYRGASGAATELGHMVVVHDGRVCNGACTGRGHLEAYVSGLAATAAAAARISPPPDARRLVELAVDGEATARSILDEMGAYLGSALGALANTFEPEVFVIGGGFGLAAWEFLLPAATEVLRREALMPARDRVRIARAALGSDAGLVGAGLLGLEAHILMRHS